MNFKFENDLENNLMTLHIDLVLRKRLNETKVRIKWKDALSIVEEHYTPPNTHTLGSVTSDIHHLNLDNDFKHKCHGTWVFKLLPKITKITKKSKPKATSTKSTKRRSSKK